MAAPYSFESSLRVHRQAFYDWLGGLHVDYSPDAGSLWTQRTNWPILRVFASPDRPFAQVADFLVANGWFKDQATNAQELAKASSIAVFPLPLITLQAGEPVIDEQLASAVKSLRRFNAVTGLYERHPWPGHYRTSFIATVWCRKGYTADFIKEWLFPQFGNVGAQPSETYIPVIHASPWGTIMQALRFEGSDDLSVTEGNEPRYHRFTFSFSLRTWIMKLTEVDVAAVETVVVNTDGSVATNAQVPQALSALPTPTPPVQSGNLFTIPMPDDRIPVLWPKTGNSFVSRGWIAPHTVGRAPADLYVNVTASSDTVDIGEWVTTLDPNGTALFCLIGDYVSDAPFAIEWGQRVLSATSRTLVGETGKPRRYQNAAVHQFALFTSSVVSFTIAGAGVPANVWLAGLRVYRISTQTNIAPTSLTATRAVWDGLQGVPYLVVVQITSAGAGDVLTVADDAVSPQYTAIASASGVLSAVFLVQPSQASLQLTWLTTTVLANVWVQRYYSSYHGNT